MKALRDDWKMADGISKGVFVVGLILAIFGAAILSTYASMQLAVGPKGDKGDKGDTGATGSQGERGPIGARGEQGPRGFGTPDYDSGWTNIAAGEALTLTHDLGTTEVYVYVIGKTATGLIHQLDYGWVYRSGITLDKYGLAWYGLDTEVIHVWRAAQDENWTQVRVMIWKIPEP